MDDTAHGASTHFWIVTTVDEDLFGLGGDFDGDFLSFEGFVGGSDNEVEDFDEVVFAEGLEDTDLVETIEKLGLEFARRNERVEKFLFEIVDVGAGGNLVADEISAGVGSGDNDRITETDFAIFFVAKDALVKDLEKSGEDGGVGFFDFVE